MPIFDVICEKCENLREDDWLKVDEEPLVCEKCGGKMIKQCGGRFKLVYDLLSIRFNIRLRINTFTHELCGIDSCDRLYFTAGWYECEI